MFKLCKTEQSAKRQREIELTFQKMLLEMPFEDISISALCDRMNMPRKAFYRYFDGKDGLMQGWIQHTLLEFQDFSLKRAEATAGTQRTLRGDLEQFFLFWIERREFLDALERAKFTGILLEASLSFSVSDMINPRKFLPDDTDWMRTQVFFFAICGLMSAMLEWYRRGFVESAREMATAASRMLSRPLFPALEELGILD